MQDDPPITCKIERKLVRKCIQEGVYAANQETRTQKVHDLGFRTLKGIRDEAPEESLSPVKPMSYAMLPSGLNNPKFLSEVGPGFKFSLNKAKI